MEVARSQSTRNAEPGRRFSQSAERAPSSWASLFGHISGRSNGSALAGLIDQASRGSETFSRLLATSARMGSSMEPECGHSASLPEALMQVSGPTDSFEL